MEYFPWWGLKYRAQNAEAQNADRGTLNARARKMPRNYADGAEKGATVESTPYVLNKLSSQLRSLHKGQFYSVLSGI